MNGPERVLFLAVGILIGLIISLLPPEANIVLKAVVAGILGLIGGLLAYKLFPEKKQ